MKQNKKYIFLILSCSLLINLKGTHNDKQISVTKNMNCKQFHEGIFEFEIEGIGKIRISREKNVQIENRTSEYYTKELIEWLDDCTYEKTYIDVNDPIISKDEKERYLKTKFRMKIINIIDSNTFEVVDLTYSWRLISFIYKKVN